MKININEDDFLEMLLDRLTFWTQDEEVISLYEKMYSNYIDGGVFEGNEQSINSIVDNDYINWCRTIEKGEPEFKELLKIYKKQGIGDCSCECDCADFIEAADNEDKPTIFLVR